jgi:hypothetical protein
MLRERIVRSLLNCSGVVRGSVTLGFVWSGFDIYKRIASIGWERLLHMKVSVPEFELKFVEVLIEIRMSMEMEFWTSALSMTVSFALAISMTGHSWNSA